VNFNFQTIFMSQHISLENRWGIIALDKYAQWSQKDISESMNIPRSTVSRTLKRHRETGDVEDLKKSGRPPIISIENFDDNLITKQIENDRQITSSRISTNLRRNHDIIISSRTIRRMLHILNYRQVLYKITPLLNEKSKKKD